MIKVIDYFRSWTFDRYFRLAIGAMIAAYAFDTEQYGLLVGTGWFAYLAFSNTSCCGSGGCNTSPKKSAKQDTDESPTVNFEEIK